MVDEYEREQQTIHNQRMREREERRKMCAALTNILSIARREQSHPIDLHMTAFSIIEKTARSALPQAEETNE